MELEPKPRFNNIPTAHVEDAKRAHEQFEDTRKTYIAASEAFDAIAKIVRDDTKEQTVAMFDEKLLRMAEINAQDYGALAKRESLVPPRDIRQEVDQRLFGGSKEDPDGWLNREGASADSKLFEKRVAQIESILEEKGFVAPER